MKKLLLSLLIATVTLGIAVAEESDAAKHNSTQMNATSAEAQIKHDDGLRVVFIGNSITLHGVAPKIGWHHAWGMAASAAEKDFVHLVTKGIEEKTGRKCDVRVRNLANFERKFREYDLKNIQDLADFRPDYLIIALGENVPHLKEEAEQLEYREAFARLLKCFLPEQQKPRTVVRGVFWPSKWKDKMMSQVASDYGLVFVKADISTDPAMMALGLFEHKGVQHHPGDAGMAEIAKRILAGFFPEQADKEKN